MTDSLILQEAIARIAAGNETEFKEMQRRAMDARIRELSLGVFAKLSELRADLLLIRTITESVVSVSARLQPQDVERNLLELAALTHTLPHYPSHPEAAKWIGQKCEICKAKVIDVEVKHGIARVLICQNGHRTIPPRDGLEAGE